MQKNSQNFSMQEAMQLANSDAGQRLLAILKQSDSSHLQQAMDQAAAGDFDTMCKTLAPLLESKEVQSLLKELGG